MQRKCKYTLGRGATVEHFDNYIWTQACKPIHRRNFFFLYVDKWEVSNHAVAKSPSALAPFSELVALTSSISFSRSVPSMTSKLQGLCLKLHKSLLDWLHFVEITPYKSPECLNCILQVNTQSRVMIVLTMTVVSTTKLNYLHIKPK